MSTNNTPNGAPNNSQGAPFLEPEILAREVFELSACAPMAHTIRGMEAFFGRLLSEKMSNNVRVSIVTSVMGQKDVMSKDPTTGVLTMGKERIPEGFI